MNHTNLSPAGNALPMLPPVAPSSPAFTSTPGRAHPSNISDEARHSGCRDGTTAPPMALPKTVGRVEPEKPATHAAADCSLRLDVRIGAGAGGGCTPRSKAARATFRYRPQCECRSRPDNARAHSLSGSDRDALAHGLRGAGQLGVRRFARPVYGQGLASTLISMGMGK